MSHGRKVTPARWERQLRTRWATVRFYARALRLLVPYGVASLAIGTLGAIVAHDTGGDHAGPLPWDQAVFVTYKMLMGELADKAPAHPVGQAMAYLWPLLGIFLMAEGLIKIGMNVFRKEEHAEAWVSILAQSSRGHVVVCGLGSIGFRVIEELVELGEQVFVVELRAQSPFIPRARALGVEVLVGDARTENLLISLNVPAARAVIIVTNDDLANMEIAMDVRGMAPDVPVVMRLYDQQLAQKVKASLGVSVSMSTSKLAAPLFASSALDPAVVGTHRVGDRLMLVLELEVKVGSGLIGRSLGQLREGPRLDIVAVQTPGKAWEVQPPPTRVLECADRVQVMLPSERLREVHKLAGDPMPVDRP